MKETDIKTNGLINYIFPGVILVSLVISFWSGYQKLYLRWDSGDNNYCYLVVPLFLYLLWDIRKKPAQSSPVKSATLVSPKHLTGQAKLKAESLKNDDISDSKAFSRGEGFEFSEFSWNVLGIIPVLASIGLIVVGELGSVETLMYMGIWGCVVGIVFTLYGWRFRYLIFPLIILAFIVPLPPFINRMLTFQLKMAASSFAVLMLRGTGLTVFQEGNIIDLGITQLQVVDACSGMRYLMPLILIALLVGHFYGKKWWRRGVLLLLVIPVSVVLNAFRIWLTGILTAKGYEELAQSFFHDFSGWLIFMLATAIMAAAAFIMNKIGSNEKKDPAIDPGGGKIGLTKPIALTVIICLMFISSGWSLKQIPSARNLPARTEFKAFPNQIGEWAGTKGYLSKEIMEQLWADDYVSATFRNHSSQNIIYLFIPFYEYQGTRHTVHAPQSCLLGGGWSLLGSKERSVQLNPEEPIRIMTMMLQKGDAKILGSYFFFQRGRVITSPWLNKLYLMVDSFKRGRTDGALVRVEMVMAPGQSIEDAWKELEAFIAKLWPILPDFVPL